MTKATDVPREAGAITCAKRHAATEKWEKVPAAEQTAKGVPCPRWRGGLISQHRKMN
jgi:hypothetical protein